MVLLQNAIVNACDKLHKLGELCPYILYQWDHCPKRLGEDLPEDCHDVESCVVKCLSKFYIKEMNQSCVEVN